MPIFQNSDQVIDVIGGFFKELAQDSSIAAKLQSSGLKIKFHYQNPDASLLIDLTQTPVAVLANDTSLTPDVEMSMKADTAHRFWQGQVNLVTALARREITAKGPIPKILKLLPIIKPAYSLYPPYLKKRGFTEPQ